MFSTYQTKKALMAILTSMAVLLSACGDGYSPKTAVNDPPPPPAPVVYRYSVTVTNLTNAQPMSPIAVVLHNEGLLWQVGESASQALEVLAESGDNTDILGQSIVMAGESGMGILLPGNTETIAVSIEDNRPMMLSVATMLVNTNDAFTGFTGMSVADLAVGESISLKTGSYDSGTEKNTEAMSSIPGPAGGGEGYNEMRDDVDFVAMHPGIVSSDDGLSTSVLTQAHRFDNPTLSISITRTE